MIKGQTKTKRLFEVFITLSLGVALMLVLGSQSFASEKTTEKKTSCHSTREYITTLEYLRDSKKLLGLSESQINELSEKVVLGCTGAASRFIRTVKLLTKVEVATSQVLKVAAELAQKDDETTQVFLQVFKRSYLSKYLDLDLATSIKFASALSLDFKGNVVNAGRDFENLVRFCRDEKTLGLPVVQCASMAVRVVKESEGFEKGASKSYIKTYLFLKSKKGPSMATGEALQMAFKVISNGPLASENFLTAYKYAVSEKGLDLGAKESIRFAQKMAKKTQLN